METQDRAGMAEDLFELLLTAAHRLSIEIEAELTFEPVSVMGVLALRRIAEAKPPMTLKVLAGTLGSSRASATQLVNRLARDELVERVVGQRDLRSRALKLTADGKQVAADGRLAVGQCMKAITRDMDPELMRTLVRDLDRFERAVDWHRTTRLLGLHAIGGPGCPKRNPSPHVR